MASLKVSTARATEILDRHRGQGETLVNSGSVVMNEAEFETWLMERSRWVSLTKEALEFVYTGPNEAEEFERAAHTSAFLYRLDFDQKLAQLRSSIIRAVNVLMSLEERLDYYVDLSTASHSADMSNRTAIFLVHGHDHGKRDTVARFLQNAGPGDKPIILDDLANRGRTLVEKLEQHADDSKYAVVLLTGDDEGALKGESARPRARQNVILELGWFCGLIGREHVAVLYEPEVEIPSDIDGLAYIPLDGDWEKRLVRELREASFDYSLDRV